MVQPSLILWIWYDWSTLSSITMFFHHGKHLCLAGHFIAPHLLNDNYWQTKPNSMFVLVQDRYLLDCCMCCCLLQTWSHYTYSNMLCQNTFWITLIQICGYFFYRIVWMDFFYKVMRHKKKKKFMISCFLLLSITFTLNNPLQSLIFYLKRAHPCQ